MKFIHISDLHLGKRVNEFSMMEDQAYILNQILDVVEAERPDGVLIAGDVYDKPVPPAEAVQLFDDFLVRLSKGGTPVFIISGNHDSAGGWPSEAVSWGRAAFMCRRSTTAASDPWLWKMNTAKVFVHLIPFLKPAHVRRFFPDEEIGSYTDAMRKVVACLSLDGPGPPRGFDPSVRHRRGAQRFGGGLCRRYGQRERVGL